jgi:hypothetical protein
MSDNELKKQHETISVMNDSVADISTIVKNLEKQVSPMFRLWPYVSIFFAFVTGIITATLFVSKWNDSLVKRPEYVQHVAGEFKRDSTLAVKVDTNSQRIADINRYIQNKHSYVGVTQTRDKNGAITYKKYY